MALGKDLKRKIQNGPGWLLVCFLVAGAIAGYYYHNCKPWRDTITFGASVVGALFAIYTFRSGVEQNKRQIAHHLIERWNNPAIEEQKNVLRDVLHPKAGAAPINPVIYAVTETNGKLQAPADEHKKKRSDVVAILSFCEEVALAVNVGSANENLVRRYFEQVLADIFYGFKTWIDAERKAQGDNDGDLYGELQTVVAKWKVPRR